MFFSQYDIRGIYGTHIGSRFAFRLGKSLAMQAERGSPIVVGHDSRYSSPRLLPAIMEAWLDLGFDVINLSLCTTPLIHFAQKKLNCSLAVMITASHNPIEYNGFKIIKNGKVMDLCLLRAELSTFQNWPTGRSRGKIYRSNLVAEYIVALSLNAFRGRRLKIAWDCGGGALARILPGLVKLLDCHDHLLINDSVDVFKITDPSIHNTLGDLAECVKANNCDVGFAFDTDGDRLGVIDHKGRVVMTDHVIFALLQGLNSNGKYLIDVKISRIVKQYIERKIGGEVVDFPAGRALFINTMTERGGSFAGESSGHIFFPENNYDDALFAAIRLVNLLSSDCASLDALPECFITPEIRMKHNDPFCLIYAIERRLSEQGVEFSKVDGLRVDYEFGWWLIRGSNTERALVMRFEGYTREGFFLVANALFEHTSNLL